MAKEIKLLPCPFCGESGEKLLGIAREVWARDVEGNVYYHFFACCDRCGATMSVCDDTPEGAAKRWNRRAYGLCDK